MPEVGIIGLGLIGGSVGLALKKHGAWRVTGYDSREEPLACAVALGACDATTGSIEELSREADIVVIATPSSLIPETGLLAARFMRPGSVLTDTGSAKSDLQRRIIAGLPAGIRYVGGHPMAGSEKSGLQAASADMFRGAVWALTASRADRAAVEEVAALVRATGARPLVVDAGDHDLAVAYSSHLPYLLAIALTLSAEGKARDLPLVKMLLARGFRDTTRLARSDPRIAMDYCIVNRQALLDAIAAFEEHLRFMRAALRDGDLHTLMNAAKQARDYLER